MWLKTLYRKRAVTWPFIFYTIIWTLSYTLSIYLFIIKSAKYTLVFYLVPLLNNPIVIIK
ncbi:hypothetical protein DVX93_13130 [Enterococcus faecium]|nr:hypothetical protein DVX93_13130 [Enterococcus faecium]